MYMSNVFTLQEVVEKQGLGPDARAFCEALLKEGEVLAVALNYLPETVLWLVTTPCRPRLMRDTQPGAAVLTLGEASDLARAWAIRRRRPSGRWRSGFSAPAPDAPSIRSRNQTTKTTPGTRGPDTP